MINYNKINVGDVLRITGSGASGYAKLGDLVRVTKVTKNGVTVEDKNGQMADFVFHCGAGRLEPTEFGNDLMELYRIEHENLPPLPATIGMVEQSWGNSD